MNKKQLMVLWIMGILIGGLMIFAPKYYVTCSSKRCITWDTPIPGSYTKVKWYVVMQGTFVILIFGGLSFLTLRDKKTQ